MTLPKFTLPTLNQWIAIAAVVLAAITLWTIIDRFNKPEIGVSVPPVPAKEVKGEEKIKTDIKVIYVYPDKVKKALNLPANVQEDSSKHVIAAGKIQTSDRPYTFSATVDTQTGQGEVFVRPDALPWIGLGKQGALGVAYGFKNEQPMGWVYGKYDLIRVKALHIGTSATLYQDRDRVVGGYVEWRF